MSDNFQLPAAWSDATILDGLDILPSAEKVRLKGVPFLVTNVRFQRSTTSDANICYVDIETIDGEKLTFTDASTGVAAQIQEHLTAIGKDAAIESGDDTPVRLVAPKGLRVSEYEVDVVRSDGKVMGKRPVKTFYLTVSGTRTAPAKPAATAKRSSTR